MGKKSKALACIYKPLGWFPVIVINGIAVWSYFAYVIILCFDVIQDPLQRALYLLFFHPFFILFMTSYWQTIMSSPGYVPAKYYLNSVDAERYENAENPQEVINELARDLPIVNYTVSKGIRFCETCCMIKPDRCHHCSMCSRCILKMDHHCPWVNNCVGWGNYKYFLLFLSYAVLYTMYVTFTTLKYFIEFWASHMKPSTSLHILFLFFVGGMFSISLWSLLGFHIFLTLKNRSTLESFRAPIFQYGPDKNGFSLGKMNNFKQVFGNNKWKWFLPIFSTLGTGYRFRTARNSPHTANGSSTLNIYDIDVDSNDQEKDGLLENEEPTTIYNSATFVNGEDINLNVDADLDSDDSDIATFNALYLRNQQKSQLNNSVLHTT